MILPDFTTACDNDPMSLALASLRAYLVDDSTFDLVAQDAVIANVRRDGFIDERTEFVYTQEIEVLNEVLTSGFPAVSYEDPAWDADAGLWSTEDEPLADAPDYSVTTRPDYWSSMADCGIDRLPCVSGGSLDDIPEPFEPSEADWAEFREWCESVDALDAFNDDRLDN